jgi:RNA polymerase sigma factor (sigma-70 family)
MTEDKPYFPWPGVDERSVVKEMICDRDSRHWEDCSKFVQRCVFAKAKNIPNFLLEEIVQEVMYKVTKYLQGFHFQCTLKTWLNTIIEHCIIDTHRKLRNVGQFNVPYYEQLNESDGEGEGFNESVAKSAEDIFLTNDDLRNALTALIEYTTIHSNTIRDRLILRMVIIEGHSHVETSKTVGCNAPVVGYVVREAQRYAREKMGHKL